MDIVEDVSTKDLEKILEILPEPGVVYIAVDLQHQYSLSAGDIIRQVKEKLPGIVPSRAESGVALRLKNPTKENILQIYNSDKQVELKEAIWGWENEEYKIILHPHGIKYSYEGEEPELITKLRQQLQDMGHRVHSSVDLTQY